MTPWQIDFAADALRDYALIFDHLTESYMALGESASEAMHHAAARVRSIQTQAARLGTAPLRGTAHDDVMPGLRHLTLDRAVYWFVVDEAARRVQVLAIFFGGQDHRRHMLVRLLAE